MWSRLKGFVSIFSMDDLSDRGPCVMRLKPRITKDRKVINSTYTMTLLSDTGM